VFTTVDTTAHMAEHEVNTDRVLRRNFGMRHFEGGWPENVDGTEADQVDRYLKRANKDAKFKATAQALGALVEGAVKQNNCADIYEEYFDELELDLSSEPPSARGTAVFRDPAPVKRSATAISWHPEGTRIAVAYSVLKFQDERTGGARLPPSSYIWDVTNPNAPIIELSPPSPLVSLRFNVKTPDILCGGSYNGLVHVFDVKKPRAVVISSSSIDRSHYDPVYDTFWIQSKTNNQFVSVSTDGRMLFWDTRKLSEPTDEVSLSDGAGRVLGGSSMEYNVEAGPAKYLVGTEQGIVLSANMKKKGAAGKGDAGLIAAMDMGPGKHHGPITAIQRNPAHPSYFLTVGDWCVKFWSEKNKTPIFQTPYSKVAYTGGAWSPTRAGVFFVTRSDGVVEGECAHAFPLCPLAAAHLSHAPPTRSVGHLLPHVRPRVPAQGQRRLALLHLGAGLGAGRRRPPRGRGRRLRLRDAAGGEREPRGVAAQREAADWRLLRAGEQARGDAGEEGDRTRARGQGGQERARGGGAGQPHGRPRRR